MKQFISLSIAGFVLISCNSHTDLEILKPNQDISNIVKDVKDFEKTNDTEYGLLSYESEKLANFRYGDVTFSNYNVKSNAKNSLVEYTSTITFSVENEKSNKLTALVLNIEKESEGNNILNYLKSKLGNPLLKHYENRDNHLQAQYLWDNKKNNQLVYVKQHTEYLNDFKNGFVSTQVTIVKKDLKLKPDVNDERNNPEKIKKLLVENPNAFDLFEIFKSRFSDN